MYMDTLYMQNMAKQKIHGKMHAYTHILNL